MKSLSIAFKAANAVAILGWLALFSFPLWPQAARMTVLTIVVALLCVLYTYFLFFAKHLDEPGAIQTDVG